jgi:5'-nucleotidase
MSSIVRSFLLGKRSVSPQHSLLTLPAIGSAYIFRHKQMQNHHRKHLSTRTDEVISRAHKQWSHEPDHQSGLSISPTSASSHNGLHVDSSPSASMLLSPGGTSRRHVVNHSQNEIRDALHVARHDHMSSADCFVCPTRLTSLPLLIDLFTF